MNNVLRHSLLHDQNRSTQWQRHLIHIFNLQGVSQITQSEFSGLTSNKLCDINKLKCKLEGRNSSRTYLLPEMLKIVMQRKLSFQYKESHHSISTPGRL
jgi:hypothetical protein